MSKETYYFSHDSNSITDTKILNMRADYGLEGYGLFWAIIEMMRNEEDYKLPLNKNTYRAIKTLTNATIDIEKFVKDCIEDYKLFEEDNGYFYSKSFLKRMLVYEKKKETNKKNGKLGGRPKIETQKEANGFKTESQKEANGFENKTQEKPIGFENKTETKPMGLKSETEKNQNKGKESKEKENKENKKREIEEKRKRIVELYNSTAPLLPHVQKITDKRKKAINNFLKEFSIEQFEEICKIANSSDFLTGINERRLESRF